MINIIIIILIILLLISYKIKTRENIENVNIDNDINNIIKQIYKTDFNKITDMSNKLDNIKLTSNINLTNNFTNTGNLKIINSSSNINTVKITGNVNFTKKNDKNILFDIFPKYFIMIWTQKEIPTGWVLCDGKTHTIKTGTITFNVTTPDFRGVFLRGTTDINVLNNKYGSELQYISATQIPNHNHTLSTKYEIREYSNLPRAIEGVGFDYEKILTNNNTLSLISEVDRSYDCTNDATKWFINEEPCVIETSELNNDVLKKMRLRNLFANIYYGASSLTFNRYTYTDIDTPLGLSDDIGVGYVRTADMSGNVNLANFDTNVGVSALSTILNKRLNLLPAYCALNYIMKIS